MNLRLRARGSTRVRSEITRVRARCTVPFVLWTRKIATVIYHTAKCGFALLAQDRATLSESNRRSAYTVDLVGSSRVELEMA